MKIQKEQLIELYLNKGMTQQEIGEYFGCDRKNIHYYLKKYDIPIRSIKKAHELKTINNGTFISINDIIERIEKGMLIGDICNEFNVSRGKIYKITKEHGYNFTNHKAQREKQSKFMEENNPVPKNSKRENSIFVEGNKIRHEKYLDKIKDIDYNTISKKKYSKLARYFAYKIEYNKKVPKGMNIDHIYSIKDGYINKVPIEIISHKYNLRLITITENRNKYTKSLITLEELYSGVGVQRLSVKE